MTSERQAMGPDAGVLPRRLYRSADGKMVAGVAAGLAHHLGLPVLHVRIAFVALCLLSGFGAVLYGGLWLAVPQAPPGPEAAPGIAAADRSGMRLSSRFTRRRDLGPVLALVVLALGLVTLGQIVGLGVSPELLWPALVIGAGVAIIWTQTDAAERVGWARLRGVRLAASDGPTAGAAVTGSGSPLLRVAIGVLVVVVGVGIYVATAVGAADVGRVLAAAAVVVAGVGVIAGPWVVRLVRLVSDERNERILSQERADVAAHLHDSVLQTLALIQRQADEPRAVVGLARRQERELRAWLYGAGAKSETSLCAGLQNAADDVEARYGVPVEVVAVGDVETDPGVSAVVLAAREAIVNAAKHSQAASVDVYAEVGPAEVSVFVRDRGVGFDLSAVPDDRHGVRGSIIERLRRHGGDAAVDTEPGQGTEVRITMPLRRPTRAGDDENVRGDTMGQDTSSEGSP